MMWVHLWNILNVILTRAIHLIPHNSWQSFEIYPTFSKCFHHMVGGNILITFGRFENVLITLVHFGEHLDHIQKTNNILNKFQMFPLSMW